MAEPQFEIRNASSEPEIEETRAIFLEYEKAIGVQLCFQSFEKELAGLPGAYAPPRGRLYLARAGTGLAGCIALRPFGDGDCEMKRLYVRETFRGTGLGRRLAERVIEDAKTLGYGFMYLDTLATMKAAQRLYETLGFSDTEPYRHNLLEGVRYMRLDLRN